MQRNPANLPESHPTIKFEGVMVCRTDMQPRDEAIATMISHQLPHEGCSVAFASMRRMRADTTDLRVAVKRQALATHCNQLPLEPNAIIGTHLARPPAKKTGKRERRQRNHLRSVVVGERNNINSHRRWNNLRGQYHLDTLQRLFKEQLGRIGVAFTHDPNRLSPHKKRMKL